MRSEDSMFQKKMILDGLNSSQIKSVTHFKGPCMVLAGPGSGKTLTIAKRIEYLLKVYKVRPEEILVITFTKYAANEMKQRYRTLCGSISHAITCGTFHGIFYGILKWAYGIDSNNILSEQDKKIIIKTILQKKTLSSIAAKYDEEEIYQDLIDEIGSMKNQGINFFEYKPFRFEAEDYQKIYREYELEKNQLRKIDFEDMILKCKDLFEKREDILIQWRRQFRFILVDEFQDVNQVQYDVLKLLSGKERNLFVVGDDDQSIYGFRGAKPGIMKTFQEDFPDLTYHLLDVNYRSDANIVNYSLKVVKNNKERFPKKITAEHRSRYDVHLQALKNPVEESIFVVNEIKKLISQGIKPEDIAILSRTMLDSRLIAERLVEEKIMFSTREKIQDFYNHPCILDLLSYLAIADGRAQRNDFIRIINKPNRFISRDSISDSIITIENLKEYYKEKDWMVARIETLEKDLAFIKKKTPFAAIQYLRKKMGYDEAVKDIYQGSMDIEAIYDVLEEFQSNCQKYKTIEELFEAIKKYQSVIKDKTNLSEEGVRLLSIHTSKGLEFDSVFIIRCNENAIPHKKAILTDDIEEERRLFYVAMTRAKRKLILSYVKDKNGKEQSPSRFVDELLTV